MNERILSPQSSSPANHTHGIYHTQGSQRYKLPSVTKRDVQRWPTHKLLSHLAGLSLAFAILFVAGMLYKQPN